MQKPTTAPAMATGVICYCSWPHVAAGMIPARLRSATPPGQVVRSQERTRMATTIEGGGLGEKTKTATD
jgi:hypothetical protein